MSAPLKDARIELRATVAQKESIETAAAIEGRSLSDFSLATLTERAELVIARDREVRVNARDLAAFVEILERPAQPIEGLRELLTRSPVFVD